MKYYQDSVSDWSICYKDKTIIIDTVISETITRYPDGNFTIEIKYALPNEIDQFNLDYLIKRSFTTHTKIFNIKKTITETFPNACIALITNNITLDNMHDTDMRIIGKI